MTQQTRQQAPYQTQTQQTGTLVVHDADLVGSYRTPVDVNRRIDDARCAGYHIVGPAPQVGQLPEGFSVALNAVRINPDDCYATDGGKQALDKSSLQRIAAAAGVSWDPARSGRTDDRSDPHYCSWQAVGTVKHFDGTLQTISASKEMDLRKGSPQIEGKTDKWIRQTRQHIMAHAETKAQLRAIRSIGIKTSYTKGELEQPFLVAKLMFTGQTDDPALRREFARMIAQSQFAAQGALYGQPQAFPAPAPQPALSTHTPPPVGSVPPDEDYIDVEPEPPRQPRQAPPQQARAPQQSGPASTHTIPGGPKKGTPLVEASDEDLDYWSRRIGEAVENPEKAQWRDQNQALLDAMLAEMDARKAGGERY